MKKPFFVLLSAISAWATSGYAAVLVGNVEVNPATSVTFSSGDTVDWAIWDTTDSTAVGSISSTNTQSGGAGLISAITPFSTVSASPNTIRGVGGTTQEFSYSNGTSPTAQSNASLGFVANSTLATAGRGVQLSIIGDPGQLYQVNVWTVGFAGQGEMRASLHNASTVVLSSEAFGSNGVNKASNLFSFEFMPDSISDLLTLSFHLQASGIGANGHVGIQAVTISAVPEPASCVLLLGLGGLTLAFTNRRPRV
tara:strand:+ start:117 stop:875 length:759 start_codon:yes stop_codon:yes gene_type:complete